MTTTRWLTVMVACTALAGSSCESTPEPQAGPTASPSPAAPTEPAPEVARRLGPAPSSCRGPRPRREQVSRAYAPLVGEKPLWAGFYARYEPERGAFAAPDAPRTELGFRIKVLWVMAHGYEGTVSISGVNAGTGSPLVFGFEDTGDTTTPVLSPESGGVGEGGWKEFPSYVYFDRAGCFVVEVASDRRSWRVGFGFGSR